MKYAKYKPLSWLSLLSILTFSLIGAVDAQNTVQVFTKTIDRNLNYQPGDTLEIMAEKADVGLRGWDRDYIAIKVKLISKHAKSEIAEKELDYLKFVIDKQGNSHSLKNYFAAEDNFRKVKGRLLIHYELSVPRDCPVKVNNLYGKVAVNGLGNSLSVNTRFVELNIKNCDGDINIESIFGKAIVDKGSGILTCDLKKADMDISGFHGEVEVQSNYGKVHIEGDRLISLTANGNRTRMSLLTSNLQLYNYDLNTSFSEVKLPDMVVNNGLSGKNSFKKVFNQKNPLITIHTTYSPIEIILHYNASSK